MITGFKIHAILNNSKCKGKKKYYAEWKRLGGSESRTIDSVYTKVSRSNKGTIEEVKENKGKKNPCWSTEEEAFVLQIAKTPSLKNPKLRYSKFLELSGGTTNRSKVALSNRVLKVKRGLTKRAKKK